MSIAELNSPVVENIDSITNSKGLKQCFIAEKIGVTERVYSDMMNGRTIIRPAHIAAIAEALGVSVNDLFAKEKESA